MAERTVLAVSGAATGPVATASPTARRLRRSSWLDFRLILGILLVLASVMLGARVIGAADSSVRVWAVTRDLAGGTTLTAADIRPARVRLFADADRYLRTDASPAGRTLTRDVGEGELLPHAALSGQPVGRLVSLPVPLLHAPDSLRPGQRVDVFATTKAAGGAGAGRTTRVLAGVPVQAVRAPRGGLAGGGTEYAVLLRVPPDQVRAVIAAVRTADIDVTAVTGDDGPATIPSR